MLQKIEKQVSAEDVENLGLATDLKIGNEIGMLNVKTVSSSYFEEMKAVHLRGIGEGLGVDEIAVNLRAQVSALKDKNSFISHRIAKTETTRIYNAGSLEGYKVSDIVKGKEWVTNTSGNPRNTADGDEFDHLAADGEIVDFDKPFTKTGEDLMYPGDQLHSLQGLLKENAK